MKPLRHAKPIAVGVVAAALALAGAACNNTSDAAKKSNTPPATVRLGYFPNLTHAPAIVGVRKGYFQQELGGATKLETKTFNAGPDVVTALFSDALDISYIGPNPALNAYQKSNGEAIRIIAGATSGGAGLVVKPGINNADDLRGKTLASPQLGNTQDVALRAWLKSKNLSTTQAGGGDTKIKPQANSQTLETFKSGDIDGAWVPEPWTSRLVIEGKGKLLVNEASLWSNGRFPTTVIIVRTKFLQQYPDTVKAILRGHLDALGFMSANASGAQTVVNEGLKTLTGKALKSGVIAAAWRNLEFTADPVASALGKAAEDAIALGLLAKYEFKSIYDVTALNAVLAERSKPPVVTS